MILSDQHLMIREMARQFAAEHLAPYAADWDQTSTVPQGALKEMGNLGLLGMLVPEEWGGAGLDYLAYVLALEQIAGGDGGVSTIMSVNNSPVCSILTHYGTAEQKARFLKPLARGDMVGAFALTEPQAGSDASNLITRARRDGDVYVINGSKQFITSGQLAGMTITFAVTDPEAGKRGISAFLVPTDTPGYQVATVEKKWDKTPPTHANSSSKMSQSPLISASETRAKGIKLPWPISKRVASGWPLKPWAWPMPPMRALSPTPRNARRLGNRLSSTKPLVSASPTWPRKSKRHVS